MVDDAMTVEEVLGGNVEAFRTLVERHGGKLFSHAYRLTGNPHDADDVVQEAFMKAFRNLHRFDHRAQFSTWLYRIACNCAIDRRRRTRSSEPIDDHVGTLAAPDPGPERLAGASQAGERVQASLARLSAQERAAFVLRHYEGMAIAEIGETLDLSVAATKNAIFRAVRKLRAALAPYAESPCST